MDFIQAFITRCGSLYLHDYESGLWRRSANKMDAYPYPQYEVYIGSVDPQKNRAFGKSLFEHRMLHLECILEQMEEGELRGFYEGFKKDYHPISVISDDLAWVRGQFIPGRFSPKPVSVLPMLHIGERIVFLYEEIVPIKF
ncbi:hypothetical protein H6504_03660 [Candidatus Woesearchaeota archaeon]|nr:hypothetical protein [Candidatus Woesearchaeota archaeon]